MRLWPSERRVMKSPPPFDKVKTMPRANLLGDVSVSDITPESVYLNRRSFLKTMGIATAALAWPRLARSAGLFDTNEPQTPYEDITHYNNFYEFGTDKTDPAKYAGSLKTRPWA